VPEADERLRGQVARFVAGLRKLDLKKAPSIAETLDWARGLCALGIRELDAPAVRRTLALVLKHEDDLRKAESKVASLVSASVPADGRRIGGTSLCRLPRFRHCPWAAGPQGRGGTHLAPTREPTMRVTESRSAPAVRAERGAPALRRHRHLAGPLDLGEGKPGRARDDDVASA
jgi:hypothetical protein